jgi:predicted transcriptional regulator
MSATKEIPMRITIDLTRSEYDRLQQIARGERRPLRDQAAWAVAQYVNQRSKEDANEHAATW